MLSCRVTDSTKVRRTSPQDRSDKLLHNRIRTEQMRRTHFVIVLAAIAVAMGIPASGQDYAIGADVSFLAQAEKEGVVFKDNGVARPGLQILKDHGYNWVRLRLFHTPTQLPNNLAYTIALAKQAKKLGFKFLLDY